MKILQYLFDLFFKIYAMREFYTLSLTICFCLTTAEEAPDARIIERLKFIRDNTHEKIMLPLSTTEMAILMNLGSNISKAIEFKDNSGKEREYPLHKLIQYAKASYFELAMFVTEIGKKYSLDIPMRQQQQVFELPTAPDLLSIEKGVVPMGVPMEPAGLPPSVSPLNPELSEYADPEAPSVEGVEDFDEDSVRQKKKR